MPLSFLIALLITFGIDTSGVLPPPPPGARGLAAVAGLVGGVGLLAFALGHWVAWRVGRRGSSTRGDRGLAQRGGLVLLGLALAAHAAIIHGLGWPAWIERTLRLKDAVLLDEVLMLAPFLMMQVLIWWGLYAADRALRPGPILGGPRPGLGRYLVRKGRLVLGAVLPVVLGGALVKDLVRLRWPALARDPNFEIGGMAALGLVVLVLAPALIRLSFPTRSLPAGELRDRLERLSRRFRFRCSDIRVWDTGGTMVNAGVTGALPWFRYVLLSDLLIELLEEREVEAVFGHEVGHIAHRHLGFFGLFFLGSIAVLSLLARGLEGPIDAGLGGLGLPPTSLAAAALKSTAVLASFGAYILLLFGLLSRRFERQADVYGCRVVSCDRPDCPPHADLNAADTPEPVPSDLCPVGIRTFANALEKVASLNGIDEGRFSFLLSWRHGRVARRIAFLNGLEGRPLAERRFQSGVRRLRLAVACALGLSVAAAWFGGLWPL